MKRLLGFRGIIAVHDYKEWDVAMTHVVEAVHWYAKETGRRMLSGEGSVVWFRAAR